MDIEHSLLKSGIKSGYKWSQTQDTIKIKVYRPSEATQEEISFEYLPSDNSITLSFCNNSNSGICGRLYNSIKDAKYEISEMVVKIVLTKVSPKMWPLVISDKCAKGIDSKSLFMLGVQADSLKQYKNAWNYFRESSEMGYVIAKLLVADILISSKNPYGVKCDIDRSISILSDIYSQTKIPEIGIKVAAAYKKNSMFAEAKNILQLCSQESDDAKLMLAKLLSPIFGELDEPEISVKLFTQLSESKNPEAMRCLGKHMVDGIGIEKNREGGLSLIEEASAIDGTVPETIRIPDTLMSSIIGASIGIGLVAIAFCVFSFFSRRRK